MWEMIKSNIPSEDKHDLAISFDEVLGLGLSKTQKLRKSKIPIASLTNFFMIIK